ncbi:hypothetical protein [Halorubrum halophilum]|uniref:hypothetical protein n=1 Tax=Halorubrum halophilum TaxID=413816 RepID=UPI00186AC309|nr:hypothetical protein [Halorubrum halophilum]
MALPLIRNYYFLGSGDSLSNLGRGRSLLSGDWSYFHEYFLHPGIDGFAVVLTLLTNFGINRSYYLVVLIFGGIYIIFSSLLGATLMKSSRKAEIAIFSSLLLAPINHMGTYLLPRASSMAVLFIPFLIYLFLFSNNLEDRRYLVLSVVLFSLILIHPRVFVSLALAFVLLSAIIYKNKNVISPLYIFGAVLIAYYLWVFSKQAFRYYSVEATTLIYQSIISWSVQGTETVSQATSGANRGTIVIIEYFIKNFLPGLLILGILGLFILHKLISNIKSGERTIEHDQKLDRFLIIFIAISVLSGIWFISGVAWVRFHGLIMAVGIPLGAIAIDRYYSRLDYRWIRSALSVFFIVLLLLSVASVHASPYLFKESGHVTKASIDGYSTMIQYESTDSNMVSLRKKTRRYKHQHNGVIEEGEFQRRGSDKMVPPHLANRSLHDHYSGSVLLPSTEADRTGLIEVKNGYQLNQSDIEYLELNHNRVYTNRDTKFYHINAGD